MQKKTHPLIPYFGGKSRVADKIISHFPPHRTYCEVFGGGLSVLLTKSPSKNEVVNDYDTELLHLYKMAKFRLAELLEGIEKIPLSRRLFQDWLKQDPTYLNDTYRAVRKLYIIRLSFGGRGWHFGSQKEGSRFNHELIRGWLDAFWNRTRQVMFECLDAAHFIETYDHRQTFFYVDPPYLGKDEYAQKFGGLDRQKTLRSVLGQAAGKWILSHHDCPEIRALYSGCTIRPLVVPYSLPGGGKGKRTTELLISNY